MVSAFAPASIGNVICGFDVLGMAVKAPGDTVDVRFNEHGKVVVTDITGDGGKLPRETLKNTAGVAISALRDHLGEERGIDIVIHKQMPLGSGLGSSAASAVAGVVAANALLGNKLSKQELLPFVVEAERIACGAGHADNVAPSLLGGISLVRSYDPLDVLELPTPDNIYIALVHPDVELMTKDARNVLPRQVPMHDCVSQMGHIASFVHAVHSNDHQLLGKSLVDVLAEPYRAPLIPHFDKVKKVAMYAGALAFGISGSGPSMFAMVSGKVQADQVGEVMVKCLEREQVGCQLYVSKINRTGAMLITDDR